MIDEKKLIAKCEELANDEWNKRVAPASWADAYRSFVEDIDAQPTVQPQGIDKDRLIEFIDDIKDNIMYEDEFDEYSPYEIIAIMDELIDFINQQPTSDGWIPVSERLPDENMWCLVTYESGEVEKVKYCATNNWGQNDECITAWRPLPQPYKESEEE